MDIRSCVLHQRARRAGRAHQDRSLQAEVLSAKCRQRKASSDLDRAGKLKRDVKETEADLEADFQAEVKALAPKVGPSFERLKAYSIKPTKTKISVKLVSLVWSPGR